MIPRRALLPGRALAVGAGLTDEQEAEIAARQAKLDAFVEQHQELQLAQGDAHIDLMRAQTLASLSAAISGLGEPRDDTATLRLRILALMDEVATVMEAGDDEDEDEDEDEDAEPEGGDDSPSGPGG